MEIELIAAIIKTLFALIALILGILVAGRFVGRLRRSVIFLICAIIMFIIMGVGIIIEDLGIYTFSDIFGSIICIISILFILLAIFTMKQMINGIDGHYKKKK